jgi:hypothetical protein
MLAIDIVRVDGSFKQILLGDPFDEQPSHLRESSCQTQECHTNVEKETQGASFRHMSKNQWTELFGPTAEAL